MEYFDIAGLSCRPIGGHIAVRLGVKCRAPLFKIFLTNLSLIESIPQMLLTTVSIPILLDQATSNTSPVFLVTEAFLQNWIAINWDYYTYF